MDRAKWVIVAMVAAGCGESGGGRAPAWSGEWIAQTDRALWTRGEGCSTSDLAGVDAFTFRAVELADGGAAVQRRFLDQAPWTYVGEATRDGFSVVYVETFIQGAWPAGTVASLSVDATLDRGVLVGAFGYATEARDAEGVTVEQCRYEVPFEAERVREGTRVEADDDMPAAGAWIGEIDPAPTEEGPECPGDAEYGWADVQVVEVDTREDGSAVIIVGQAEGYPGAWSDGHVDGTRVVSTGNVHEEYGPYTKTTTDGYAFEVTGDEGAGTYSRHVLDQFESRPLPEEDCTSTWSMGLRRVLTLIEGV